MRISLTRYNSREVILFRFSYDPRLLRQVKALPSCEWFPELAAWGVYWSPLAAWLCRRTFPDKGDYTDEAYAALESNRVLSVSPLPGSLFPFQQEGVRFLQQGNAILHDCPGAGKTRQAIAAATLPCLIVAPTSVLFDWQEEISTLYPKRTTQVVRSRTEGIQESDYLILSPQMMRQRHKDLLGRQTLILDEIHQYRNPDAKQTRAMMAIATRTQNVIGLTGTLIINRAADLFSPLVGIKKLRHADRSYFYTRYCGGDSKSKRIPNGLTNETELREFIAPFILHRTREDLGRTLPLLKRKIVTVALDNQEQFQTERKDIQQWLIHNTAAPPETKMIRLNRLRRIGAIGKVHEAVTYAKSLLAAGEKVIVACSFLNPLRMIQKLIPSSIRIEGRIPMKKRKELVRSFQESTTPMCALCSIKSVGIGITMTSACKMIVLDLPWSPADLEQVEARIYRETQTRETEIIYLLGEGTIDATMLGILRKKADWCQRVFRGGDDLFIDTLAAAEAMLTQSRSDKNVHDVSITSGYGTTISYGSAGTA